MATNTPQSYRQLTEWQRARADMILAEDLFSLQSPRRPVTREHCARVVDRFRRREAWREGRSPIYVLDQSRVPASIRHKQGECSMKNEKAKTVRGILAEGEVTGHAHVVDAPVRTNQDGTRDFARATAVVHEEHGQIALPPVALRSGQVVEFDPFTEVERNVAD